MSSVWGKAFLEACLCPFKFIEFSNFSRKFGRGDMPMMSMSLTRQSIPVHGACVMLRSILPHGMHDLSTPLRVPLQPLLAPFTKAFSGNGCLASYPPGRMVPHCKTMEGLTFPGSFTLCTRLIEAEMRLCCNS